MNLLDLRETRPQIRASLEARRVALKAKLSAIAWGKDERIQRRTTEAERRILALATGQTFVPDAEPDVSAIQRELDDVEQALRLHDAADVVAGSPALQSAIDTANDRIVSAVRAHVKALRALVDAIPDLRDVLDDARIAHITRSQIADAMRALGDTGSPGLTFRPEIEQLGQQLLVIAEHAEDFLKYVPAAGVK